MDVQAEKLKWLNRTELEMLSDKSLSLHEREKISESLRTINSTWNKVCIKNYYDPFLMFVDFVVKEVGLCNCSAFKKHIPTWAQFTNA